MKKLIWILCPVRFAFMEETVIKSCFALSANVTLSLTFGQSKRQKKCSCEQCQWYHSDSAVPTLCLSHIFLTRCAQWKRMESGSWGQWGPQGASQDEHPGAADGAALPKCLQRRIFVSVFQSDGELTMKESN